MFHCAAINCTNSSSKKSDNTFSFFKLPKDPNRRKVWIAKLKRANLPKDIYRIYIPVVNILKKTILKGFESKLYFLDWLFVSKMWTASAWNL